MRFLVISENKHPMPPEMAPAILDGMIAWAKLQEQSGKVEAMWATAGVPGGGGILNVDSLDELDAILSSYPLAPFSKTEVIPIVDIVGSLQRTKEAMQRMMPGGGR